MESSNLKSGIRFDEDLVVLDIEAVNRKEVLRKLGGQLTALGHVNEDYTNAVIKREQDYPTGIQTANIGVAIPHTDVEYVNKACIIVGVLKEPVVFKEMGYDGEVDVKIVFMLAIKEPHQQLILLQRIISIIQNDEILEKISTATNKTDVVDLIKDILGDEISE